MSLQLTDLKLVNTYISYFRTKMIADIAPWIRVLVNHFVMIIHKRIGKQDIFKVGQLYEYSAIR